MMKLYIYDHCPYCVKARIIFGLKDVPVELVTLANDDEQTPVAMIGKKMLPILEKDDGNYMPESLDIVEYIDHLDNQPALTGQTRTEIGQWLEEAREYIYKLAMPRWVDAPMAEFQTKSACDYFTAKKEAMIGDFTELRNRSAVLIGQANNHLGALASLIISPEAVNGTLCEDDLHLFANLRSLSIVQGITYPPAVEMYRQQMAKRTGIKLHDDIAR